MSDHKLQPVRGTKDLFGDEVKVFNHIVEIARKNSELFGFEELQTPIFEFSEIFERNLGEASDIVSKEVYKFRDRGENFLTLRPEFTAGIVRALISNGELQQVLPKKFFSYGPIFRYDRPQKGRQRQFHQINFEVFGEENFYCDVEVILLAAAILKGLGVLDKTALHINSLGDEATKAAYAEILRDYFREFKNELSADSQNRLETNPLRILDSKDARDIELSASAPQLSQFFSTAAKSHFENILNLLTKFGVKYHVNSKLVRGLDYYNSTVFEFVMSHEGAQNTVLAGGRYDNLVEKMGGKKVPAIGFAAGIERLMLLSETNTKKSRPISVAYISDNEKSFAFEVAQDLRTQGFEVDFTLDGNFKKQMKRASQNNAKFVVIIGENEVKSGEFSVKNFDNGSEEKVKNVNLANYFSASF